MGQLASFSVERKKFEGEKKAKIRRLKRQTERERKEAASSGGCSRIYPDSKLIVLSLLNVERLRGPWLT